MDIREKIARNEREMFKVRSMGAKVRVVHGRVILDVTNVSASNWNDAYRPPETALD